MTRRTVLRLLAVACAVVTGLCFTPQVSQAEFIFTTAGQAGIDSRQPDEFASYCTAELVPRIEPMAAEPTKREPAAPEAPPSALTDVALDGLQDATTSGPVTAATGGCATSPAVLGTADLRLSLAGTARSHTVIEDLAPDSPPPSELLDPPRR